MARVAVRFAYDGTLFDSFARQPGRRTVEGELLRALEAGGAIAGPRAAGYEVASRTDRRVSAWANVLAVDSDMHPHALAHLGGLPAGLWFVAAAHAPSGFSPRRAATRRTYRYGLRGAGPLDLGAMRTAVRHLVGVHDFANFARREPSAPTRRRLDSITFSRRGEEGTIRLRAPNFLWEQVRRLVHGLLDVGRGARPAASLGAQLRASAQPEPASPPEPLILESVDLPLRFPRPSKALASRVAGDAGRAWAQARFYAGLAASLPRARR